MDKQIFEQSMFNLRKSVDELSDSVSFLDLESKKWKRQILSANFLDTTMRKQAMRRLFVLFVDIKNIKVEIKIFRHRINSFNKHELPDQGMVKLISRKKVMYEKLRAAISSYASLSTFLNWQSPSIRSSKNTRMGIEKYPIRGDYNDYKRDRSGDTFYCERNLQEKIFKTKDSSIKQVLNLCNSGMAAFTSIIYFLVGEGIVKNKILVSSNIYVESYMVVNKFFKNKIATFDFNDTELIIKKIVTLKPDVVFLDVINNTFKMPLYDVLFIIERLASIYTEEIFFVIDITCSMGLDDFFKNFKLPKNIKIIIYGSMLKTLQIGIEMVNAGFVLSSGLDNYVNKIGDYRTLSGSTIQDFGGYLIPITSRHHLRERLKMIERNSIDLATFLKKIDPDRILFDAIIYPGLSTHPDFELYKKIGFAGPFFNMMLNEKFNKDKYFELFTSEIIKYAQKYDCDIVHGASFGFNQTSIYYSVGWDSPKDHYLRISMGIETSYEIEKIKKVFYSAYETFKRKYLKRH
ncbi:MAG: PLP-dependent transferase [Candidatus Parcubacteria bacterium]|nr:PLP-dependent transferase [Candidatus Parcubacteria bacterium]